MHQTMWTRSSEKGVAPFHHFGSRKRSLALRELALGLEALHRFVAGEPLRRVRECVLGILALESEPVYPRL